MQFSQKNECPKCGQSVLYFSADGLARACENCDYQEAVPRKRRYPQELLRQIETKRSGAYRSSGIGSRALLAQGISAIKSGKLEEGSSSLLLVLQTSSDNITLAEAWVWLSEVFEAPQDKQTCLEEALALNPGHVMAQMKLAVVHGRLSADEIVSPEKLEREIPDRPLEIDAAQFVCPRCTGPMKYVSDGQELLCEFCTYRQAVEELNPAPEESRFGQGKYEQEFLTTIAMVKGHWQPAQMRTFLCYNCTVEFILAPETISLICPYCNAVYVTKTSESHEIIPIHALVPFTTSQDEAKNTLRQWFKKRKIEQPQVTDVIGIYLPAWTFDISGEMKWSGIVNSENKGTGWVNGKYLTFHDDVLVPAAKNLSQSISKGFSEFDLDSLVAYDARYLASWPAERYQVALSEASLSAQRMVRDNMYRDGQRRLLHHEPIYNLTLNINGLHIESFKHILLPTWVTHYKANGQVYDVVVNGQTGLVHGERSPGIIDKLLSKLFK